MPFASWFKNKSQAKQKYRYLYYILPQPQLVGAMAHKAVLPGCAPGSFRRLALSGLGICAPPASKTPKPHLDWSTQKSNLYVSPVEDQSLIHELPPSVSRSTSESQEYEIVITLSHATLGIDFYSVDQKSCIVDDCVGVSSGEDDRRRISRGDVLVQVRWGGGGGGGQKYVHETKKNKKKKKK